MYTTAHVCIHVCTCAQTQATRTLKFKLNFLKNKIPHNKNLYYKQMKMCSFETYLCHETHLKPQLCRIYANKRCFSPQNVYFFADIADKDRMIIFKRPNFSLCYCL